MDDTQIIETADGIRIEATVTGTQSSSPDEKIDTTINAIKPMLDKVIRPIADAWKDLSTKVVIKQAEIEIGFGIEASGNFFVASTKGNVNLKVKLLLEAPVAAE